MATKIEPGILSDREEQVLLLSTKGLTDKEIARKLDLSIATVNTYWVRIRTKLGGANRAELVAAALNMNAEETLTAKEIENQRLIGEIVRRAEAEKALRDSQERLQAIIDGTSVVISIKDALGRYTLVNSSFEKLLQKDRKEIVGKRDHDLFPLPLADNLRNHDKLVLERGEHLEFEEQFASDGVDRTFLTERFPLFNLDGERYAVCAFSRDFTGRFATQAAIRKSEEQFRSLIEHSADLVTLIKADGTIVYSSPSTERVLGYKPEEVVGKNVFGYVHRKDLRSLLQSLQEVLKEERSHVQAEYSTLR